MCVIRGLKSWAKGFLWTIITFQNFQVRSWWLNFCSGELFWQDCGCWNKGREVNGAAVNMSAHVFVKIPIFSSLGVYLGVELLGHMIILCLLFWGTAKLLYSSWTVLYSHKQCIRISRISVSPYPHQHLLLSIFDYSYLSGYEAVSYCDLMCISLMTDGVEHLFICLLTICMSPLGKCLFRFFACF